MEIIEHLKKFGFAVQENVITKNECEKMGKILDEIEEEYKKNRKLHSTESQTVLFNVHLEKPEIFMDKIDLAIIECKNAIFIDPDFGNPYNDIGCYLLHFGKTDEAIGWFKKSLAAKKYESYYFPNLNLGRVYTAKGEFDLALKYFRLAIKENPMDDQAHSSIQQIQDYLDNMDHSDSNNDKE